MKKALIAYLAASAVLIIGLAVGMAYLTITVHKMDKNLVATEKASKVAAVESTSVCDAISSC